MEQLGINPILIGVQIVNFVILLFVLKKVLYKPVLDLLEKRQQRIAESEAIRTDLEKQRDKMKKEQDKLLKETRKQAEQVLEEARQRGEKVAVTIEQDARRRADELIAKGKQEILSREQEMWQELRNAVKQLAVEVAEQTIATALTPEQQKQIASDAVRRLKASEK